MLTMVRIEPGESAEVFNQNHAKIIELFIKYGIIEFSFNDPFTFSSGILSPVYCDIRKCLAYPDLMQYIENGLMRKSKDYWVLAGVATGALPHIGRLQKRMNIPVCYVRPGGKPKTYGKQKRIEGAPLNSVVYLIEDVTTTGKSIEHDARIFLEEGVAWVDVRSIFAYDSDRVRKRFDTIDAFASRVTFMALVTLNEMLPEIEKVLTPEQYQDLLAWHKNPETWRK